MQYDFLPVKTGLSAFAQLQQHQIYRKPGPVAHKTKSLCLQMDPGTLGDDLSQPLGAVDQTEIAAVFQSPGGGVEKVGQAAVVLPTGQRQRLTDRPAGKIGRVGDAEGEASGRKQGGNLPQIRAYTFHTGVKGIAADVFKRGTVGLFAELDAGDLAGRIPGTQQKPQRSAARAQIQNPGLSGKPGKMGQHHGICAQRKSTGRNIQLIALWQCFHEASPLMVFHRFYIWYASSEAAGRRRVL